MRDIKKLKENYTRAIINKKEICTKKYDNLINDDRKDEAILEKIKVNVLDIFTTMIGAMEKQVNNKEFVSEKEKYDEFCILYLKTFDRIPESWKQKLINAKDNNDIVASTIEERKLSVVLELKDIFTKLMEEN